MNKKKVYLIGIGMGSESSLTKEAMDILGQVSVVVGAKRMIESFQNTSIWITREEMGDLPQVYVEYHSLGIADYIGGLEHSQVAVLLSGDVGFCSGAKKLLKALEFCEVVMIPGITTVAYLASRLNLSWEDMNLTSLHGTSNAIVNRIHHNPYTFTLLGGKDSVNQVCELLMEYGMEEVKLHVGECLSYPNEKVQMINPAKGYVGEQQELTAVIIENPDPCREINSSIEDEEFIRGKVPMTKAEVREVSISKLKLTKDAICYDIGAGTGSIGIEIACKSPDIQVYAIEKNPEAVELIEQNKRKFRVDNVRVVEGFAPQDLEALPAPTHAFLGGTTGNLEGIVYAIWEKNPNARIVLNAIALETVAQAIAFEKKHPEIQSEIVQLQVSKARTLGDYHMMTGQNPIYIISWQR
ncbi:MAG TPA: bifunctional cobalt-precorrin-7 (C(5))-methyltransferase/cobalt-precorrin-6B (C(15))-methyltransferase [Lachnospiraceae bacterium]|uniref:precorrin-6Y C5,15-methyltransferase (decarboxylating) subunit CbiT n=1 Tax=Anaerosporobacter sp. TaxID=1872529 RepID=UPI000ECDC7BD|nr:precorrin-6Y C5,15-methyltransferase (decarboxylating) subunit CbiT [Anaerosporobacter sp.]HAB60060.1 bifunctional cobalt-precorrin-7 (C(5))-methyltransferase/cobalt-precorrin-6B (C(15))-methyltransferase [Lachnospiraceae bacterium]